MLLYPRRIAGISALIASTFAGTTAALAQAPQNPDSQVPTFQKEIKAAPAPVPSDAVPQLRPVAPVLVVSGDAPVPGDARIVPPPPRLLARAAGRIAVPSALGASSYRAADAALSTPLQVNSGFGYRGGRRHNGIDFQASWGDSVGASMAGTVVFAGIKRGYGNLLILDHGHGVTTYYAHLSAMYVGLGQTIAAGQVIGAIGTTGRSSGPHLHYEVRINGDPVNPNAVIMFDTEGVTVDGEPAVADDEEARPRRVVGAQ
jgi:murein DD-endopeptidase MepM/ murein hydrolase activator NlpD